MRHVKRGAMLSFVAFIVAAGGIGVSHSAERNLDEKLQQVDRVLAGHAIPVSPEVVQRKLAPESRMPIADSSAPTFSQIYYLVDWFGHYAGRTDRDRASRAIGRLIRYYYTSNNVQFDVLTGVHPDDVLENMMTRGLDRLGYGPAAPYLIDAYVASRRPRLKSLLEKHSPVLLKRATAKMAVDEAVVPASTKDPAEAARIVTRWKDPALSMRDLNRSIQRIGEVGSEEQVPALIARLQSGVVSPMVMQTGLTTLGELGGPRARAFLADQLRRPVPAGASLDDYGAAEAIARSMAALALGNCGDRASIRLLEEIAADPRQYKRVREASKNAIGMLRLQFPAEQR